MMLRIVGAILISICGGLWGVSRSIGYRNGLQYAEGLLNMIRKTQLMISYENKDLYEIVHELSTYDEFSQKGLVLQLDENEYEDALSLLLRNPCEKDDAWRILADFWKELGTSDSEGQIKMLSSLEVQAKKLVEVRVAEYEKYGKMYRSVGILFGLMAGIAVI